MNLPYLAYNFLVSGLYAAALPPALIVRWVRKDLRRFIDQRFGIGLEAKPDCCPGAGPRIWIHAVSVGEVAVAEMLVRALRRCLPHCVIVLSTATRQGQQVARKRLPSEVACFYAPLDVLPALRRVLGVLRPHILVCLETELWPNLLAEARRFGALVAVVNGRLSVRSVGRYRKMASIMRHVLENVDVFSMISADDARRMESIGALSTKIEINGNAKWDVHLPANSVAIMEETKRQYGLQTGARVLVAGSTRQGEERIVLDAYRSLRASRGPFLLVLAPRHVERAAQVARWAAEQGLDFQFHSELATGRQRKAEVVIVDTMGDLFRIYSLATVVFCGGSLVPLGGQNILEPAAWGKPVLYGPHMEDFSEIRLMLERCGAAKTVWSASDLARAAGGIMADPVLACKMGQAAQDVLRQHQGAVTRHAEVIRRLWQQAGRQSRAG